MARVGSTEINAPPEKSGETSWQRTLWVMAAVQCIMMMAFSSMGPFLALYIEQLGVHNMHQVDIWAGVISSANFLIMALVSPLWGALADRKGRKVMVLRTTFAISVFTFCMGLCQNVWELLFTRMMQGVFSGFSASAIALVATVIPEERLGYSLGWLQSAGMIGSLIGPLAGGFLSDYVHSYRMVFFLTSGFAMTAFIITALLVKERFVREDEASNVRDRTRQKKPSLFGQFRAARGLTAVRTMFLVLFLAQFSVMSVQPVLPVYIKELTSNMGHLGSIAGFAFSMTGLADLIGSPFLGKRSDKLGYRKVLTICLIGAGLFYLGQACAPNVWFFIAARFGLGLFVGGILPTANALVGRLTPKDERGKVYGFTSSATFLGAFAGPIIGGFGSAVFGIRAMLCVTCVLYVLNMIWVRRHVVEPKGLADQPGT